METNKFLSEDEKKFLVDNTRSLLRQLCDIGVILADSSGDYKQESIIYRITVPEISFQFSKPEETALKAKEILLDNAKIFDINQDSVKVMYNIRLNENWTKERHDQLMESVEELIDQALTEKPRT